MNEMRIVRGTDVTLYADSTPLFGVTAFSASEKLRFHEVYEYLNAKPCERIPQGAYYEIQLSMMSLFDHQLPSQAGFTLKAVDGGVTYSYENCRVTGRKTELKGNGHACEVFTVEADELRRTVAQHE